MRGKKRGEVQGKSQSNGEGKGEGKGASVDTAPVEEARRRVYRGSLSDFVARRKAAVADLRAAGLAEEAKAAARWPKPSVTAWAVNEVVTSYPAAFDRLVENGAALRSAQSGPGGEGDVSGRAKQVREAAERRRASIDELVERAERALGEGGHGAGRSALNRIRRTFEALSSREEGEKWSEWPAEKQPGLLVTDLEPPAFDGLLAGLASSMAGGPRASSPRRVQSAVAEPTSTKAQRPQPKRGKSQSGQPASERKVGKKGQPRSPPANARKIAARLEHKRLSEQAEATRAQLHALRQEAKTRERNRQRREKALARRQDALAKQRLRLQELQAQRDEAAREHDQAVRAHRRSELEILKLEQRLSRVERELLRISDG